VLIFEIFFDIVLLQSQKNLRVVGSALVQLVWLD